MRNLIIFICDVLGLLEPVLPPKFYQLVEQAHINIERSKNELELDNTMRWINNNIYEYHDEQAEYHKYLIKAHEERKRGELTANYSDLVIETLFG